MEKKYIHKKFITYSHRQIYVADFETFTINSNYYKENNKTASYAHGIKKVFKIEGGKIYENKDDVILFHDIKNFIFYIKNLKRNIIVYFHNLKFDVFFIKYWVEKNKLNDEWKCKIIEGKNELFIYEINFNNGYKVKFWDSYKLAKYSLNEIGKILGGKNYLKGNFDFDTINNLFKSKNELLKNKEICDYLIRDIKILSKIVFKFLFELPRDCIKATLPSITKKLLSKVINQGNKNAIHNDWDFHYSKVSRLAYRKTIYRNSEDASINSIYFDITQKEWNDNLPTTTYEEWKFWKKSHKEAVSFIVPQYINKTTKNVISYDINSLYPYIMVKFPLPFHMPQNDPNYWNKNKLFKKLITKAKPNYYSIKKMLIVKINSIEANGTEKDLIPINMWKVLLDKEYLNEWEIFISKIDYKKTRKSPKYKWKSPIILLFWEFEWEKLIKLFKIEYEIIDNKYVICDYLLQNRISQLNQKKEYYKEQKDLLNTAFFKSIMNNLYGKFAEKKLKPHFEYIKCKCEIVCNCIYYRSQKVLITPNEEEKKNKFQNDCYSPIWTASYITARARVIMYDELEKHTDNLMYCDTDSMKLDLNKGNIKINKIHPFKLGYWKKDAEYSELTINSMKSYFYKYKGNKTFDFTMAGRPWDAKTLIDNDNQKYYERIIPRIIQGGVLLIKQKVLIKK